MNGRGQIPKPYQQCYRRTGMGVPRRCHTGSVPNIGRKANRSSRFPRINGREQRGVYVLFYVLFNFNFPLDRYIIPTFNHSACGVEQQFKHKHKHKQHTSNNRWFSRRCSRPRSTRRACPVPSKTGRTHEEQASSAIGSVCESESNPRRSRRSWVPLCLATGEPPAREWGERRARQFSPRSSRRLARVPTRVREWHTVESAAALQHAHWSREPDERG